MRAWHLGNTLPLKTTILPLCHDIMLDRFPSIDIFLIIRVRVRRA